ncbi:hypothetical protein ACE02D_18985 [Shewanella bicestrii]
MADSQLGLTLWKQRVQQALTVPKWLKHPFVTLKQFWLSLNLAQRCYLLALLALMLFQPEIWIAAIITAVALIIEFWPRFAMAWHTLAGKLFSYYFMWLSQTSPSRPAAVL